MKHRLAVLGAGSWGATLADVLARKGHDVSLWEIYPEAMKKLRDTRSLAVLPQLRLHESALVTSDLGVIYESAQKHGMKVVAITITPWSGFRRWYNAPRAAATHEVNRWIREQLGKSVDYLVDAWPLLSCGNPEELCTSYNRPFTDGLHFGPKGHEKLAEARGG